MGNSLTGRSQYHLSSCFRALPHLPLAAELSPRGTWAPSGGCGGQEGPCTHSQMRYASSKKPMKVNGESLEKKFAPSHSTANTRSDQ